MTADRPDEAPDHGGSGPLVVMLIAFAVLCAGSLGVAGFFVWRAVEKARERAADAQAELNAAAAAAQGAQSEPEADLTRDQFHLVAKAAAEGLAAPQRLADSYTSEGKPLLSWRVHLLPRLGRADLYRRFKLDEPWDGPTNKRLLELIPAEYDPPGPRKEWGLGWTCIRGFAQEGAIFEPFAQFTLRGIPAGADNTLAIFESIEPAPWTKPDGLIWRAGEPRPGFGSRLLERDWFLAATASGRVVRVPKSLPDETLRQLFDRRHDPRAVPLPAGFVD